MTNYFLPELNDDRSSKPKWALAKEGPSPSMNFVADTFEKDRLAKNLDFLISCGKIKPLLNLTSSASFAEGTVVSFENSTPVADFLYQIPVGVRFSVRPSDMPDGGTSINFSVQSEQLAMSNNLVKHNLVDSISVKKNECFALLCPFSPGYLSSGKNLAIGRDEEQESVLVVVTRL